MRNKTIWLVANVFVPTMLAASLGLATTSAFAADPERARDVEAMQARMQEIMADPAARDAAAEAGEARGKICAYCHGSDGISKKAWLPNLAGQSARYILDQNLAYASGERENNVMNELAKSMTDEELINLSIFYAVQTPERIEADVVGKDLMVGENYYQSACKGCHGDDGRGEQGDTWIAGQKQEYVRRALARYRDEKGGRLNEKMGKVTAAMTDQLISNLAAYIATLK